MFNFINTVDNFVVDLHQWVIDALQCGFRWAARQSLYLLALSTLAGWAVTEWPSIWLIAVLLVIWTGMWVAVVVVPPGYRSGLQMSRVFSLVFAITGAIAYALDATEWWRNVQNLALLSYWCFLSCEPPRPRRRSGMAPSPS